MTDFNDLKTELDQIWQELHGKQDRVKPAVIITLLIWLVGATVSGAWWAATITGDLANLQQAVLDSSRAQYTVGTASQDFRLRDQQLKFMQDQIQANTANDKATHGELRNRLREVEDKQRELELKLTK